MKIKITKTNFALFILTATVILMVTGLYDSPLVLGVLPFAGQLFKTKPANIAGLRTCGVAATGDLIVAEPVSTEATKEATPNLLLDAIFKKVIQTHPSSFPLDTIMSYMPTQNTNSWEFRAYDVPYLPYISSLAAASTASTPGAVKTISPISTAYMKIGSLLWFKGINGSDDNMPYYFFCSIGYCNCISIA